MAELRSIPLDALHRRLGARFAGFAGYDMPIQYPDGLKAEHLATRQAAGLFDVSHMGQLRVTSAEGEAALHRALEAALPIDFEGWPVGLQKYSYLLNEQGGIEDDLMLVRLEGEVRIIANAGNRDHDLALLRERCPTLGFEWVDAALLALQGPEAERVLSALDPAAAGMRFMQAAPLTLLGTVCLTTRSGYTGEDGYEISVPAAHAQEVAERLLADPAVKPVGLGARDTLRLEAGLPLHGQDIRPDTTPIEAGLAFAIPKSRRSEGAKAGGFPGAKPVLDQLKAGPTRRLVGLISGTSIPIRAHAQVVGADGGQVGEVTSGTVSPTLGRPIMLAYLDTAVARPAEGTAPSALHAQVRDKQPPVELHALPFVPKRYKR